MEQVPLDILALNDAIEDVCRQRGAERALMRKIQICVDSLCEGVHEISPQERLQFTITYDPQQIKLHIETQGAVLTEEQAEPEDFAASTFGVARMILNNMFDTVSMKTADGKLVVDLEADL